MHPWILPRRVAPRRGGGEAARESLLEKPYMPWAGWWCLPLCLLLAAAGCGFSRHSVSHVEVSGRVLYKSQPVLGGEVQFVTVEGAFASTGVIDEKGNYKINAPVGDVRISVDNRMLSRQSGSANHPAGMRGAGRPGAPDPTPIKGTYLQIPDKYYSADRSGLTYTVTSEPQTHDIELN